ncbi:hypothetical protein ACMYYO_01770 [Dermacoccaceae bacterium W4C1]
MESREWTTESGLQVSVRPRGVPFWIRPEDSVGGPDFLFSIFATLLTWFYEGLMSGVSDRGKVRIKDLKAKRLHRVLVKKDVANEEELERILSDYGASR